MISLSKPESTVFAQEILVSLPIVAAVGHRMSEIL
jgi:hypothetical protein